ncbi:hypothetical protein IV38_GL000428 [Lactobacillus selangorensis]|nr:DUF3013 family protein [Lactobacillus selangorensis]KRN29543.1 hypothetical protein IV38_GL000428 [Lactobacillus selangorensis]
MKETILDALDRGMDDLTFGGELAVNWDKEARVFELDFTLEAENAHQIEVEDQGGHLNDGGKLTYEDSVLFYDETHLNGEDYADNYLTVIPFQGRKGIKKYVLDGFFKYFEDVLADGESDLMDFLDVDETDDTFLMHWDEKKFQAVLEHEPQSNERYLYPSY